MGDAVKIKVVAANLEKRQLDYHWVTEDAKHGNAVPVNKVNKVNRAPKSAKGNNVKRK